MLNNFDLGLAFDTGITLEFPRTLLTLNSQALSFSPRPFNTTPSYSIAITLPPNDCSYQGLIEIMADRFPSIEDFGAGDAKIHP